MHSEDRVAPMATSSVQHHRSDDQLMEAYVLAGDNRASVGVPPVQGALRRAGRARSSRCARTPIREADAVFTSERLHDQRDRIMRRLERQGHPAEVLVFPNRTGQHRRCTRLFGPARRWVAGAAAAGLAAGVFLGFAMDRRAQYASTAQCAPAADARRGSCGSRSPGTSRSSRKSTMPSWARARSSCARIDAMTTPAEIRGSELRSSLMNDHLFADLPKGPRPERRGRGPAEPELSQRSRPTDQDRRLPCIRPGGSRSISRASSGSATASTARSTTPIRRASAFPIGAFF